MSSDDKQVQKDDDGNVLLRARNGDVIRYDETGLILKLSDKVVAELRDRLLSSADTEVLDDIDAWGLRQSNDWYHFNANLPGMDGARGYRRKVSGGDIIAETPGPVLGVLGLGGARRARAFPGRGAFPYHVVAPADEVGAVGLAGVEAASRTSAAQLLREQNPDALLAEEILKLRQKLGRGLPLILARAETDQSASVADLKEGLAFANIVQAAVNLQSLASSLGKAARLQAISVDFGLEDVLTPEVEFAPALRSLLEKLSKELWQLGFAPPAVLAMFDDSLPGRRQAQWDLALTPGTVGPVFTIPSYALEVDEFARLSENAMKKRAATDAAALWEIEAGRGWQCPLFLLAEWDSKKRIRLRSNASLPLELDEGDPFGAGPAGGLQLQGPEGDVAISSVTVDPNEPRDLLIDLEKRVSRKGVRLSYAWGGPGAVRDSWQHPFGFSVMRWALPAQLEVHGG